MRGGESLLYNVTRCLSLAPAYLRRYVLNILTMLSRIMAAFLTGQISRYQSISTCLPGRLRLLRIMIIVTPIVPVRWLWRYLLGADKRSHKSEIRDKRAMANNPRISALLAACETATQCFVFLVSVLINSLQAWQLASSFFCPNIYIESEIEIYPGDDKILP